MLSRKMFCSRTMACGDDSTKDRGKDLVAPEAEETRVPKRTNGFSMVMRTKGMGAIFDHEEMVPLCDFEQLIDSSRLPKSMLNDEDAAARRDLTFKIIRGHGESIITVHINRFRASPKNWIWNCDACKGL